MPVGRKPKPVHLHIIEGTFNTTKHSKRLKGEPKPVGDLNDPPAWFTAGQRAVWAYGLQHAPPGLLKAIDASTYGAWCVACDTHRRAVEQLGKMKACDGLLIESPRGLTRNPLIEIMNGQALIMLRHASEMGFTPCGRGRVTVDPPVEPNPYDEFAS